MLSTDPIFIGDRREFFWDDTFVDPHNTTSEFLLHHPDRQPPVLTLDKPWEGDSLMYSVLLHDEGKYKLYYHSSASQFLHPQPPRGQIICYAESTDGIHWDRPNLGVYEICGTRNNNVAFLPDHGGFDGFSLVKDPRPECPPDQRYKAVFSYEDELWCYTSPDGFHWTCGWCVVQKGHFDSLNTVLWDEYTGKFRIFFRGFHTSHEPHDPDCYRDIRTVESEDFVHWSEPKQFVYSSVREYQMYINNALVYPRAPHIYFALPGRYIERKAWTPNYDELCGKDSRKRRMSHPTDRSGLAVTDCLFMTSRDSVHWTRYDEAFITQGAEYPNNWVYGGCFMTCGIAETAGIYPGSDNVYSMYAFNNRWSGEYANLDRYTIRLDGFVSQHAGIREERLVTKPFVFDGTALKMNFATSAMGKITVTLRTVSGDAYIRSVPMFGDSCDRLVRFVEGAQMDNDHLERGYPLPEEKPVPCDINYLRGKPVFMDIRFSDADIYSFRFTR